MKRIGVDDVIRESLINHSLDVGDREMFFRLSGVDWENYITDFSNGDTVSDCAKESVESTLVLFADMFGDVDKIRSNRMLIASTKGNSFD